MGGTGCIDPHFLDLGTSWRWVVSFPPLPLYPRERAPGTHFIGGWADPRAGLDDMEQWKFFTLPGLELPPPMDVQPVASLYTDWAIPAPPGHYLEPITTELPTNCSSHILPGSSKRAFPKIFTHLNSVRIPCLHFTNSPSQLSRVHIPNNIR
jgi:hypothetical protein